MKKPKTKYNKAFVKKIRQGEKEVKDEKITLLEDGQSIWDLAITE